MDNRPPNLLLNYHLPYQLGEFAMKRLVSLLFSLLICWCSSAAGETTAYGEFKILGIGGQTTDPFVVVFASYLTNGYQTQYCAQTDWWWPAGTTHTWWLDRNDKITFAAVLSTALTKGNMFFSGELAPQPFGLGVKCRIDQFATR